jgi:predicted acyl esterase
MTWIAAMLVLVSSHNQPLPGGVVATAAMVPMRDNVKLSVLIFTPPGKGPWPVLLEQRYASVDGEASRQRMRVLQQRDLLLRQPISVDHKNQKALGLVIEL